MTKGGAAFMTQGQRMAAMWAIIIFGVLGGSSLYSSGSEVLGSIAILIALGAGLVVGGAR